MKTFIALALAGVTAAVKPEYNFMEYIIENGRSYATLEEYTLRLALFMKSDRLIEAHNSMPSTYILAHNKFSDRTEYEMSKLYKETGKVSRQEPTYLPLTS